MIKQAAVALIIKDGLVLSISRRKDKTKFGLIGGKQDQGETLEQALVREALEEANISIHSFEHIYSRVEPKLTPDGLDFHSHCFYVSDWSGTPKSSDEGEVLWLTQNDLIGPNGAFADYNTKAFAIFKEKHPEVYLKCM